MGKRPASPSIPTDEDSCKFWKPGDVGNAFEIVIEAGILILLYIYCFWCTLCMVCEENDKKKTEN